MSGFPVIDGVEVFRDKPPGYEVDFANPQQQKVLEHYLVFGIGAPLAFIALCQRYYTKIWLSKGLQTDDFFMFLGWAASIVTQAMLVWSISQGGMCAHSWEVPLTRFEEYSVVTYITAPVFMLCNGFTKLSLLTFYLHISPQKWFRFAVWGSIVIVALYTVIITLMMFFHCSPVRKAFDFKLVGGSCIDAAVLYMATAVSNIVTDVMLFILPIPMVLQLKMGTGQKAGAIIIFGIGSVTIATSVVRLALLPPVLASTDPSWDAAPANIWTFVEGNLFVICGSMPTLRKFFKHITPRLMGATASRTTYPYGGSRAYAKNTSTMRSQSRRHRKQYDQFSEDNEMQMFPSDERGHEKRADAGESVAVVDVGSTAGEMDNRSDKAILQTKSYTVQYD